MTKIIIIKQLLKKLLEYSLYLGLENDSCYLRDNIKKEILNLENKKNISENKIKIISKNIKSTLDMFIIEKKDYEKFLMGINLLNLELEKEELYKYIKEADSYFFKEHKYNNSLTRKQLAEYLLSDETRLNEPVYIYNEEHSTYEEISEVSSKVINIIENEKKQILKEFVENDLKFSDKNKIGEKRITILN